MSQSQNPGQTQSGVETDEDNGSDDIVFTNGVDDGDVQNADSAVDSGVSEPTTSGSVSEEVEEDPSEIPVEEGGELEDEQNQGEVDGAEDVEDSQVGAEEESDAAEDDAEASDSPDAESEGNESAGASSAGEPEVDDEEFDLLDVENAPSKFKATVEGGEIQTFLDSVSVLVDEARLRVGPEKMKIRAVDAANVGMVDNEMEAEAFESYKAAPGVLGIPLEQFEEALSLAGASDLVHLELDLETRKLEIETNGMEYTMALIDPASIRSEPDIPEMGLPDTFTVSGGDYSRALKAADMVSDHLAIKTHSEGRTSKVVFEADGDTDDVELELGNEDLVQADLQDGDKSLFSLEYLQEINRPINKTDEVNVKMGDEYPLKVNVQKSEGTLDLNYMVAPRVSTD
jgi:proliferating cell nuclear antigen